MAIYLEFPKLDKDFPFRCLFNEGDVLTTPHWHKEIEFILITKGEVQLGVNDQRMKLEKDQVVIINGGDIHYVLASPGSERLVFQFDLNFFSDVPILHNTSISLKELFALIEGFSPSWPLAIQTKMVTLLKEIYDEQQYKKIGYHYAIKSKLYEIITILLREVRDSKMHEKTSNPIRSREILERLGVVFRYIEENYTRTIKLEDAAAVINFSPYYFAKFFKKYTGKTFISFLNEYRIDKAKWILLNEEGSTITEIVDRVGFGSNKTFYRLFKHKIGLAPLEFRALAMEKR